MAPDLENSLLFSLFSGNRAAAPSPGICAKEGANSDLSVAVEDARKRGHMRLPCPHAGDGSEGRHNMEVAGTSPAATTVECQALQPDRNPL